MNEDRIAAWLRARAASGRSRATLKVQRICVARVAAQHDLDTVTTDQIAAVLSAPDWKPETRRVNFIALRSYFAWALTEGHRTDNPMGALSRPRVPRTVARPVPEDALEHALSNADQRTRLMILLAAHAGLRCAEIAAVHRSDLAGDLLTITGKGGKRRTIPVAGELLERLQDCPRGYLFPGRQAGTHLHPSQVGALVSRLLPPGYTTHKLRHRYACRIYNATHDLLAVQELLGHESPVTTRRYVLTDLDTLRRSAAIAAM